MRKPIVLVITNMYPSRTHPYFGIFVQSVAEGLQDKFRVKVHGLQRSKRQTKALHITKYLWWMLIGAIKSALCSYDILYVHFVSRSSYPFLPVAHIRRKLVILNVHGSDAYDNGIWKVFTRLAIRRGDLIVFPSKPFLDGVAVRLGVRDRSRCFVSPSAGVDTDRFRPSALFKRRTPVVFGYVSSLTAEKGIFVLLDALSEIDRAEWTLVIVGGGPAQQEIHRRIDSFGLKDNIVFGGVVPHNKIHRWFRELDFFVFPTLRESLGLVGVEALASGLPIIGSDIPAIRGYVDDQENGILFKVGDVNSLRQQINRSLHMSSNEYQSMSRKARVTGLKYDRSKVIAELSDAFFDLLQNT
jgi:L-malate glycosyltransferase